MIRYSGFNRLKNEFVVWCDADFKAWGYAVKGLVPAAFPFKSESEAATACRRWINARVKEGVINLNEARS